MTATVSLNPVAGTTRPSKPSLGTLTGIEMRKSLSTRSGKAIGIIAVLLGPVGVFIGSLNAEGEAPAAAILGFTGMLTALVLLALGVLSTAGEWTHKSVQTTFLLVPQRGRVIASKVLAMCCRSSPTRWAGRRSDAHSPWPRSPVPPWRCPGRASVPRWATRRPR